MLTNADIQPVLKHASTVRSNSTCSRDDKYSSVTLQNNSHHYYVVLRLQSRWHVMQRHVQCKCERWPLTTETCWMRHTVRQPTSEIAQSVSCLIALDKKYVPRNAMELIPPCHQWLAVAHLLSSGIEACIISAVIHMCTNWKWHLYRLIFLSHINDPSFKTQCIKAGSQYKK